MSSRLAGCRLGVSYGPESTLYSFPSGHPLNRTRTALFAESLRHLASSGAAEHVKIVAPVRATEDDLYLFHTREYVEFVKESSARGGGYLDYSDTPSFKGVFEAALYTVGSTLRGIELVASGGFDHFFNPVGGLHHARRGGAAGFCVFNDAAIAVARLLLGAAGAERVAYVDIDAHHGDGVFYGFESNPRVIIADIHEDGRFLYPGTGSAAERGSGAALGTKLNVPLLPAAGDAEFIRAFEGVEAFIRESRPAFILLQCGADGLQGDPLTHLSYSSAAHAYASRRLHALSHELCGGRILAMGGGGYNAVNVDAAWSAVVRELSGRDPPS